ENSSLVSRKLASTRTVLCASPQYLKLHGTPQHPEELAQHAVISYSYLSTGDEWRFTGPEGAVNVKTRPCMHTNSGDTCRAAALAHQGVILQPTFLVGKDLTDGSLLELMPQYRSIEFGIYAVYPTRKHVSAKVRAMIEFLAEHLAEHAPSW
ncbi:MAG: substrate binding domain-containing protein, partial [Comamonadaceae bacterium]